MRIDFIIVILAIVALITAARSYGQAAADPQAEQAIAAIEQLGGRVYRDSNNEVEIVALNNRQVQDSDLVMLQSFPKLRTLDLDGTDVSDAGLEHLMKLPGLQEVSLRRTRVSRAAAMEFKERHPGVYHIDLSPGFQPDRLLFAGALLIPLFFGVWLIRLTQQKKAVLAPRIFVRGVLVALLLIVGSLILMTVAILQALGVEFTLSDLFG